MNLGGEKECCYYVKGKWFSCAEAPLLVRSKESVIEPWTIKVQPTGLKEIEIPMYVFVEWLCEEF